MVKLKLKSASVWIEIIPLHLSEVPFYLKRRPDGGVKAEGKLITFNLKFINLNSILIFQCSRYGVNIKLFNFIEYILNSIVSRMI